MDKDSLSHTSRYCARHVVWIPKYRRKVPCGETRREVGETPGMPAGQTGGVEMVEGSACPDHTRTCLRIAPKRGAGDVVGRPGGRGATMPRERHEEGARPRRREVRGPLRPPRDRVLLRVRSGWGCDRRARENARRAPEVARGRRDQERPRL